MKECILIIFITLAGLFLSIQERFDALKGTVFKNTIEYGVTEGTIKHSGYTTEHGYRSSTISVYDIQYTYSVDGKDYLSNQIDFLFDYQNNTYYLSHYPVGKRVKVYYDLDDHSFAVLDPVSSGFFVFGLPLFWLTMLLIALIMCQKNNKK